MIDEEDTMTHRTVLAEVDELPGWVGRVVGTSAWREVTQADVDAFAETTGDRQWIHVDPERAAAGPFGATIAHGFLTLSFCAPMIDEAFDVTGAGMKVNYGLDRVRFPAPVRAGSSVRGAVELTSTSAVDGGIQAALRVTVEVSGQSKPGCVADVLIRYYR